MLVTEPFFGDFFESKPHILRCDQNELYKSIATTCIYDNEIVQWMIYNADFIFRVIKNIISWKFPNFSILEIWF